MLGVGLTEGVSPAGFHKANLSGIWLGCSLGVPLGVFVEMEFVRDEIWNEPMLASKMESCLEPILTKTWVSDHAASRSDRCLGLWEG